MSRKAFKADTYESEWSKRTFTPEKGWFGEGQENMSKSVERANLAKSAEEKINEENNLFADEESRKKRNSLFQSAGGEVSVGGRTTLYGN